MTYDKFYLRNAFPLYELAYVEQLIFSQKIPYYIFHISKAFHQCVLAYVEELFFCQKMPYHIFRKEMTFPYLQSGSFVSI